MITYNDFTPVQKFFFLIGITAMTYSTLMRANELARAVAYTSQVEGGKKDEAFVPALAYSSSEPKEKKDPERIVPEKPTVKNPLLISATDKYCKSYHDLLDILSSSAKFGKASGNLARRIDSKIERCFLVFEHNCISIYANTSTGPDYTKKYLEINNIQEISAGFSDHKITTTDGKIHSFSTASNELWSAIRTAAFDQPKIYWEQLHILGDSFIHDAVKYGKIIVEEYAVPSPLKTIKPVSLGGVAGGEKFIVQGILFKLAKDKNIGNNWLYGNDHANDYLAEKSARQELLGANFLCSHSSLVRVPLMATIDYHGHRLVATALLPIDAHSLVYGSSDGSKTVVSTEPLVKKEMEEIGKKFNLQPHLVTNVPMALCGDIEVHKISVGDKHQFMCLDAARIFPPEAPTHKQGMFSEKLRPEFVRMYPAPLSSDAFTTFQTSDPQAGHYNHLIKEATQHLFETTLINYAKELTKEDAVIDQILTPTSLYFTIRWSSRDFIPNALIVHLHKHGINLRHLGRLYQLLIDPHNEYACSKKMLNRLKNYIMNIMVLRCLKNKIRNEMRLNTHKAPQTYLLFVKTLNEICRASFDNSFRDLIKEKFCVDETNIDRTLHRGFLVLNFCQLMGVIIHPKSFAEFIKLYSADRIDFIFSDLDIIEIQPTIKYLNLIDLATGMHYLNQLGDKLPHSLIPSDSRFFGDSIHDIRVLTDQLQKVKDRLETAFLTWPKNPSYELIGSDVFKKLQAIKELIATQKKEHERNQDNKESKTADETARKSRATIAIWGRDYDPEAKHF